MNAILEKLMYRGWVFEMRSAKGSEGEGYGVLVIARNEELNLTGAGQGANIEVAMVRLVADLVPHV